MRAVVRVSGSISDPSSVAVDVSLDTSCRSTLPKLRR